MENSSWIIPLLEDLENRDLNYFAILRKYK